MFRNFPDQGQLHTLLAVKLRLSLGDRLKLISDIHEALNHVIMLRLFLGATELLKSSGHLLMFLNKLFDFDGRLHNTLLGRLCFQARQFPFEFHFVVPDGLYNGVPKLRAVSLMAIFSGLREV